VAIQSRLLQYRRGNFHITNNCICGRAKKFKRGHENCSKLQAPLSLSKVHRRQKKEMFRSLGLDKTKIKRRFTNLDFLINIGRVKRAGKILDEISTQLIEVWKREQIIETAETPLT
jgi:hypothetical protein